VQIPAPRTRTFSGAGPALMAPYNGSGSGALQSRSVPDVTASRSADGQVHGSLSGRVRRDW
jgi:hypothetical protein